jgi:hypothetical protein
MHKLNHDHEVTDGWQAKSNQPTQMKNEDGDKWGYTGSIEMMKTGRGSSFTWVASFTNY